MVCSSSSCQGKELCPHSPPMPLAPLSGLPLITIPEPLPVPKIRARTIFFPAPAPSVASDTAMQLASFATRTSRRKSAVKSWSNFCPFSHTELAFFTLPVKGEMVPGMPMPTVPVCPVACSASSTRLLIAAKVSG